MEEKKVYEPIFSFTLTLMFSNLLFTFEGCVVLLFFFWFRRDEERGKGVGDIAGIVVEMRPFGKSSNGSPLVLLALVVIIGSFCMCCFPYLDTTMS